MGRKHNLNLKKKKKTVNGISTAGCHGYHTESQREGETGHVTGQRWRPRVKNGSEREYLLANRLDQWNAVPFPAAASRRLRTFRGVMTDSVPLSVRC